MKRIKDRVLIPLLTSCACLTFSSGAFAQDEGRISPVADNPDIVVTATRRNEALQDVPMSVDVATGEKLQALNILDVKDLQRLSPGLQISNSSGRNNSATLRGISFDPDQGTSPSVDLYYNEVPVDAQTAFTAIYDIDQIEVLRGPQGALRGRTAPAGAITFRTRRPDLNEINGYVQATATDRDGYNVQGGVSLPLVTDKLAIRIAALVDGNRANQVYNVSRGQMSRSRTESARFSLTWEPADDLTINASYQYLTADNRRNQQVVGSGNAPSGAFGDPTRSGPPASAGDYIAVHEGVRRFQNNSHLLNMLVDWDLGPVGLAFVGGYQNSVLVQDFDQDSGNAIPGYSNIQHNRTPYKAITGELRLTSNNSGFWNWSLGAFYSKRTGDVQVTQKADTFFGPFPIGLGLFLPIDTSLYIPQFGRSMSISASSRFQFTDKLRLEVAARLADEKTRQSATSFVSSPGFPGGVTPGGVVLPARPGFPLRATELVPANLALSHSEPLTGGATLTYEYSRAITAYAAYGRSFRLGTSGVGVPANISPDLVRTNSERSDSFEIGLKTNLLDRRLSINVAAFHQKFDGYITRIPNLYYDFGARNALGVAVGAPDGIVDGVFPSGFNYNADATVKGFEVTIASKPTPNWDLDISGSYTHARYDNASLPCNDFNGDGIPDTNGTPHISGAGNVSYCSASGRVGEIPDFNLSAATEFRFPAGRFEPFVRALFTYRPGFYFERTAYNYKSNELLNLFLGLRGPEAKWELTVFAKNLLNQQRVTNVIGNASVPTANPAVAYNSGYQLVDSTLPREFGLTGTFKF